MYICAWQAPALAPDRLTSSRMIDASAIPSPAPPYCSGMRAERKPASVRARTNSAGYARSASSFRQYGSGNRSQISRTPRRRLSWSSSRSVTLKWRCDLSTATAAIAAIAAPAPAVGHSANAFEVNLVLGTLPAWTAGHDHHVSRTKRAGRDPLPLKPAGVCPLGLVLLLSSQRVGDTEDDDGVGSLVLEFVDGALKRDGLAFVVKGREGMMRRDGDACDDRPRSRGPAEYVSHAPPMPEA